MIKNDALKWGPIALFTDAKDPTGFVDPSAITVTYNKTTRKITLTIAAGTIDYYWRGVKHALTSPWVSDAHAEGNGRFYLKSTDGSTFAWSETAWEFSDIQVAAAKVTTADTFALRECHGLMTYEAHANAHRTVGTYRLSGGTLTADTYAANTSSDAANTPGFDAAVIQDEDLPSTIPAWTEGTYTTLRVGAAGAATFDKTATVPFRHATNGRVYVNTPSTGAETEVSTSARYVNVYQILMPVTADADSQAYRMLMLQPQQQYTSLAAAQAEAIQGLSVGDLSSFSAEYVIHARITYETSNSGTHKGKCKIATGGISYLTGSQATQVAVSGYTTQQASNVTVTAVNVTAETNLQLLLEEFESRIAAIESA